MSNHDEQKPSDSLPAFLLAMILNELPHDEKEYKAFIAKSASFSDLLREMEAKFGLESPK